MVVDKISKSTMDDPTISLKVEWFVDINTGCYLARLLIGGNFYCWIVRKSTFVRLTYEHKLVIIHFLAAQ
jgi:hypothetical protein